MATVNLDLTAAMGLQQRDSASDNSWHTTSDSDEDHRPINRLRNAETTPVQERKPEIFTGTITKSPLHTCRPEELIPDNYDVSERPWNSSTFLQNTMGMSMDEAFGDDLSALDSLTTPDIGGESSTGPSPSWGPEMDRFKSVVRRSQLLKEPIARDPLRFYADLRLTPINTDPGIWQVLSSLPGLNVQTHKWEYSLVYHGQLTFTWSLLKLNDAFKRSSPVLRPLGILQTSGSQISKSSALLTDLERVQDAKSISVVHYGDSWAQDGFHVGFQVDEDYRYEWQPQELVPGSGPSELMLWRTNIHDGSETPAARLAAQELIQHPIDHNKKLWCIELDLDRVKPHIALLSAMVMKVSHTKWHSWFAKKNTVIPPPMPLLNFAFQDEGRVYQPSGKYWGDWEMERTQSDEHGSASKSPLQRIRCFNKSYLEQYKLCPKVMDMLNAEAAKRVAIMRQVYKIYN